RDPAAGCRIASRPWMVLGASGCRSGSGFVLHAPVAAGSGLPARSGPARRRGRGGSAMVEERLRAGGRPFRRARLVVRTPDPELDEQIARAAEALGAVAESRAWMALSALAVGEFEAPGRLLRALGDR